ncbi:hypothetical protein [Aliikangiella sp. G2MR2-5]|uniref:hypothetical protein n=1 Tax=Aliikangiella sp. G2MR2-5 TaxID=2788943 RepID=UPI0018AC4628|nr:hypothetical protein [Aliikangiella sp. G2MR2-5]
MTTYTVKRGEISRTKQDIIDAGGLVPKLGLNAHKGRFRGFLACDKKKKGVMGCQCPNMNENWFYYRGVAMMRGFALEPGLIRTHTGSNTAGLLSWAMPGNSTYCGQQTQFTTPSMDVYSYKDGIDALDELRDRLNLKQKATDRDQNMMKMCKAEFVISKDNKVLGMISGDAAELSLFTPVATKHITFGAVEQGQPPKDPIARSMQMMGFKPNTERYEKEYLRREEIAMFKAKPFLKFVDTASPVALPFWV